MQPPLLCDYRNETELSPILPPTQPRLPPSALANNDEEDNSESHQLSEQDFEKAALIMDDFRLDIHQFATNMKTTDLTDQILDNVTQCTPRTAHI